MESPAPDAPLSTRAELSALFTLAWPIAIAQVGMVAMGLVDTAIVGRVSETDLAAVALARSVGFAANTLSLGIASAIEPLAAQSLGARNPARAWAAFRTTLRVALAWCIPAVVASIAFTYALPRIGVDAGVASRARGYLWAQSPGQFCFVAFWAGKSFLQAHRVTRPTIVASLIANVVNAVLCAAFVLGDRPLIAMGIPPLGLPTMGSVGAGLSTSAASLVLAGIVLRSAMRHRVGSHTEHIATRTALSLGIPLGLQLAAEVGVFALVAVLAGRLGADVLAAHQIALGLASFTFMGALGVSGATAVRVGHCIGAGLPARRVGLLGVGLGTVIMGVGAVAFAIVPRVLIRAFTPDEHVIAIAVPLVGMAAVFQLFDGVQAVASGALRGAGDVRFPFVANVLAHWAIGLPIALVLGFAWHLGALGLWIGLTAGLVSIAIALAARFIRLTRTTVARIV